MKQGIQVTRINVKNRFLLVDLALSNKVAGNLQSCLCGSLTVTALQHIKLSILDGELHVLHISVVIFQLVGDGDQLVVDLRQLYLDLVDLHRCTCTGNDILTLSIHQNLSVECVLTGCRITGECNTGSGSRSHVTECHHLYVNSGSPGIRDIVVTTVYVCTRVVPGTEYGLYSLNQLLFCVCREVLADLLVVKHLVLLYKILQILCVQIYIVLNSLLSFLLVDELLKEALRNFHNYIREHLDESSVAVPCPARISGLFGHCLNNLLIQTQVQDGVHHTRHRCASSGTNGYKQRILDIAELLAGDLFHLAHVLSDLSKDLVIDLTAVLIVLGTSFCSNGKSLRNRKSQICHLSKVSAFTTEQLTHVFIAFAEQVDPFSSHLLISS